MPFSRVGFNLKELSLYTVVYLGGFDVWQIFRFEGPHSGFPIDYHAPKVSEALVAYLWSQKGEMKVLKPNRLRCCPTPSWRTTTVEGVLSLVDTVESIAHIGAFNLQA